MAAMFPVFNLAGAAVVSATANTVAWPTHAANDVALLIIQTDAEPVTLTTANGFAVVTGSPQTTGATTGTTSVAITVYWARATSASMSSPVITDAGDHTYARILTFTNVVTAGNPWDDTQGGVQATASTNCAITGVTTTDTNELIVMIGAVGTDSNNAPVSAWSNAALTSLTEICNVGTATQQGGGLFAAAGKLAVAGPTGTTVATLAAAARQAFLTLSLKGTSNITGTGSLALAKPTPATGVDAGTTIPRVTGTGSATLPTLSFGLRFGDVRHAIILGLSSAGAEGTGWNAVVRAALAAGAVVRTSDTVVTITVSAFATYDITANETITATVPANAVALHGSVVASPTFTITATSGPGAITGSGSVALTKPVPSGAGHQTEKASGSLALAKPTLAGSGHQTEQGSGTIALTKPVLTASGKQTSKASGSLAATRPVLTGSGKQTTKGSGTVALPTMGLTATGTVKGRNTATGTTALPTVGLTGAGHQTEKGSGSLAITHPVLTGSGATGAIVGTGSLALARPAFTGSGKQTSTGTGTVALTMPTLTASGKQTTKGSGSLVATRPALTAAGHQTEPGTGSMPLPRPAFSGAGKQTTKASGTLPLTVALSGSGQQTTKGSGSLAIPMPTLNGLGFLGVGIGGSGTLAITLTLTASGHQTEQGAGSLAVAAPAFHGTGVVGNIGAGALALPTLALDAKATLIGSGSGAMALRPPSIFGTGWRGAIGAGAVAVAPCAITGDGVVANPITASGDLVVGSPTFDGTGRWVPLIVGKYQPEHDMALAIAAATRGFADDHARVLTDVTAAGN